MADTTEISWADSTFNPVIGCQRVSAACDNCYAETLAERYGWTTWGPHGERKRTSPANWRKPVLWQRHAASFQKANGHRQRVFCASLADVFDNRWPEGAREDLWALVRATPDLDWLILTKRPENYGRFLPLDWGAGYPNVWLGVTTEDQQCFDRRWSILAEAPAAIRFISYEPAVGPVTLKGAKTAPDWVIFGGESGPKARTTPLAGQWARAMRDECEDLGAAFFLKQWGAYHSNPLVCEQGVSPRVAALKDPVENGKGGGLLDGDLWRRFPATQNQAHVPHGRPTRADRAPLTLNLGV